MKTLALCNAVFVLTAVVTVYGCSTCRVKEGEKCSQYRTCCQGNCVNGTCFKPPSCENFNCPSGQECFLSPVDCSPGTICYPLPKCRDKLNPCATLACPYGTSCHTSETDSSVAECVSSPCDGTCSVGTECSFITGRCESLPGPCIHLICDYGEECVRIYNDYDDAACVPVDICGPNACKKGHNCKLGVRRDVGSCDFYYKPSSCPLIMFPDCSRGYY